MLKEITSNERFDTKDLRVEWYSGSGAGGQHRNKRQNSCRITHLPTGITQKAESRKRDTSYNQALEAVKKSVEALDKQKRDTILDAKRKSDVGSGMRGDKRRTYRFQDDIVTDHVTGKKASCVDVMKGNMNKLWK